MRKGATVKPAYEIVRAAELRVGDVFKADARNADEVVLDVEPETETVTTQSGPWGFKRLVARQLPPERNPEVLMRALEMAASQVLRLAHTLRRDADYFPIEENVELYVTSCIGKAIRELESEAQNGQ